jgi:hypothetical protein
MAPLAISKNVSIKASSAQKRSVVARAEAPMNRRAALAGVAASAALLMKGEPAQAAYGQGANVFGKTTNTTGFVSYAGDGFAMLLPSSWNPSKERDTDDVIIRYEDNFDAVNNLFVIKKKTDKSKIEDFGSPEQFIEAEVVELFGQQAWSGQTISEGGFAPGRSSAASVLDIGKKTDSKGKTYYTGYVLTRTADGNEGGRHHLIRATVSGGNLWLIKVQNGDKRWFKGAKTEALGAADSFVVA